MSFSTVNENSNKHVWGTCLCATTDSLQFERNDNAYYAMQMWILAPVRLLLLRTVRREDVKNSWLNHLRDSLLHSRSRRPL